MKLTYNKRYIYICILVISWIASIPFHKIDIDESWFGEESFFMAKNGYSTSNLFQGLVKEEYRVVVQHKLFIYLGALSEKVFGFGIEPLRAISILLSLLLIYALYRYSNQFFNDKMISLFVIIVLFCIPEFYYISKIFRPEILVTLLGFLSFYLLEKYIVENKKIFLLISGILSGLAALAHLNGMIFVFTGCILLLLNKKYIHSFYFGLLALFAFSPYLYDIFQNYELFKLQINSPLVSSKTQFTLIKPLINFLSEHQRLFRKPEIILASIPFFLSLIINWKYLIKEKRFFTYYLIVLMICLGCIVEDKSVKYSVYLAPFYAIVIATMINAKNYNNAKKFIFNFVLSLFFAFSLYYQANDILKKNNNSLINGELGKNIPEQSRCIAPMNFIFNEVDRLNITALLRVQHLYGKINIQNVAKYCEQNNVKYIIFNKQCEDWENFSDIDNTELLSKYFNILVDNNYGKVLVKKE